jgi:hypothetical protein
VETSTSNQTTETTPPAANQAESSPPGGSPPGGASPGNIAGSAPSDQALSTATGAYTVDGESLSQSRQTYTGFLVDVDEYRVIPSASNERRRL